MPLLLPLGCAAALLPATAAHAAEESDAASQALEIPSATAYAPLEGSRSRDAFCAGTHDD